jgi:hypothetical protein
MIFYFVIRLSEAADHNSKGLACFKVSTVGRVNKEASLATSAIGVGDFPIVIKVEAAPGVIKGAPQRVVDRWCSCGAPPTSRAISNSGSHVSLVTCDWGDGLPLPPISRAGIGAWSYPGG